MSFDDELLLTSLGGALETVPVAPSADELDAFHALVDGRSGPGVMTPMLHPRRHPARSMLFAAAATMSLVLVGGVGLLATGDPLPNSLRAPARALGFPVDDAALARARTAMGELRAALAGPDDSRVRAAAVALTEQLRSLGAGDRAEIEAEARALIGRADARLAGDAGLRTDVVTPAVTAGVAAPTVASGSEASGTDGGAGTAETEASRSSDGSGVGEIETPEPAQSTEPPEPAEAPDGADARDTGR